MPLGFGETCRELLEICVECAEKGNKNVISDVSVAAVLIEAAVKSAFEAIDLNLGSIRNGETAVQIAERKRQISDAIGKLAEKVRSAVSAR